MNDKRLNDLFNLAAEARLKWRALAAYNAEVARGVVHTPEYDAKMAEQQLEFNREKFNQKGPK